MSVGQKQWYHFGVGAPPISVYFSGIGSLGDGVLTHGRMATILPIKNAGSMELVDPPPLLLWIGALDSDL